MATQSPITPGAGVEAFAHSPISHVFSRLLGALAVAIEFERDIEDASIWDPAFSNWLRDAEAAWATVHDFIGRVKTLPQTRPVDAPLARMARFLDDLLCSEDRTDFEVTRLCYIGHPELYSCTGTSAFARRTAEMLAAAHARVDDLCKLDMLTTLPDDCAEAPSLSHDAGALPPSLDLDALFDAPLF